MGLVSRENKSSYAYPQRTRRGAGLPSIAAIFPRKEAFVKKEDATIEFFADKLEPMCSAYTERKQAENVRILGSAPAIRAHANKLDWRESMTTLDRLRVEGTIGEVLDHLKLCRQQQLPDRVMRREDELAL